MKPIVFGNEVSEMTTITMDPNYLYIGDKNKVLIRPKRDEVGWLGVVANYLGIRSCSQKRQGKSKSKGQPKGQQ